MRVNIQFSVDSEKIPDRIIAFVKEAETMLSRLYDDDFFHETKSHIDNKNVLKAVMKMKVILQELLN